MEEQTFSDHVKKILPVFGLQKTYSKEEVITLIHKAISDMNSDLGIEVHLYPDGTTQSVDIGEWWIKNNIK